MGTKEKFPAISNDVIIKNESKNRSNDSRSSLEGGDGKDKGVLCHC